MKTQLAYERVRTGLEGLKMTAALGVLDTVLETARLDHLAPVEVVDRRLDAELKARHDRTVEINLRFAGLPYRQSLEQLDFEAQPSVDPHLIARLSTLHFIEEGSNVLILGPPGAGKTALAVGLAIKASRLAIESSSSPATPWSTGSAGRCAWTVWNACSPRSCDHHC